MRRFPETSYVEAYEQIASEIVPLEINQGPRHICYNPLATRWTCSKGHNLRPHNGYAELAKKEKCRFGPGGGMTISSKTGGRALATAVAAMLRGR